MDVGGGQEGRELRIAMFCVPAKGHLIPLCSLAAELAGRGHTVDVWCYDVFAEELGGLAKEAGATYRQVPSPCRSAEEALKTFLSKQPEILKMTEEHLHRMWEAERPCVLVGDIFSAAGYAAARKLGIPVVVNCPGSLAMLRDLVHQPDPSTAVTIGGITVLRPATSVLRTISHAVEPMRRWSKALKEASGRSLVLVNSFRGLEPQGLLPTNWILTGPLLSSSQQMLNTMADSHPDLFQWMEGAASEGRAVVYVSLGSLVKPTKWQVDTIYSGLALSGCQIIWSLPRESQQHLPPIPEKQFWISDWLPQSAILSHRATKLFISHCGWGATMELIDAGVPVYALPCAADQPLNAKILINAGAGLMLPVRERLGLFSVEAKYSEGDFFPHSIANGIEEMLSNPKYKAAVEKLRRQSTFSGHRKHAADCIEWVARDQDGAGFWENPALRGCESNWTELITVPVFLGFAAMAAALAMRAISYK